MSADDAWSYAVPDWEDRLRKGVSLVPALPLDEKAAQRAVGIYDRLRLPDVPGQPRFKEAGAQWFRDIVAALFGSIDPDTGERRVGEVFVLVPKKNAKTTNGAALMLTALMLNERPRAEFLLIGPTKMVSDLAFSQIVGMIDADDKARMEAEGQPGYLKVRYRVQEHLKQITDRVTKAKLVIKTFDSSVLTGVKPVGVLIDELHEISNDANAQRIIGQLRGGLLPNPEAFLMFITTQSDQPPKGAFKAELKLARAIRDGRAGGRMMPVLYEFPVRMLKNDEWRDTANWPMVTPNAGKSITIPRLATDWTQAQEKGDEEIRRWASQHLNVEIGLALASDRWAGADEWETTADDTITLESLIERSEVLTIGIDGGGLDDLLGLTVCGRERGTRRWLTWSRAWAHPIVLKRRTDIAAILHDFKEDGDLVFVDRIGQDIDEVVDIIAECESSGKLDKIGLDPVGIGSIVDAIAERDLEKDAEGKDRIVGIPQGWKLSGAIKSAERKLGDGTMAHADQPIMNWCVGNAKVEPRGNAITITKQAAGSAKIDPLMALFNAVALMTMNPTAKGFAGLDDFLQNGVMA